MTVGAGRTAGARARALRAAVCLLASTLLVLLAVPLPQAVAEVYPVRVTIGSLSPVLPGPDDTLTLTGTLTDVTSHQIAASHLGLRAGGGDGGGGGAVSRTESVDPLSPGESLPFTIRVPVTALDLGDAGDYDVEVALMGDDGTLLGLARTHLPWSPPDAGRKPLDVAVMWPVTDVPHMEAVALGAGGSARPVFRDDGLAGEFDEGGRLRQLVEAGAGLPVTWTVDPGLLDEAKGMTDGYRVADSPDIGDPQRSQDGPGGAPAAAWLAAIRDAVKGREVLTLPYADPDLAALAHGGMKGGTLGAVLGQSVRWGATTAASVLRAPVRDDVAWPYGGALDTGITGLAEALGPTTFVASGQGLSTGTSQPRVSLGRGVTALVGDPAIGAVLSRQPVGDDDLLAVRQDLLDALLSAQRRSPEPGGLLVVPPRWMSGRTAGALASVLTAARSANWVKLVGLDEMAPGTGGGTGADGRTGPGTGSDTRPSTGSDTGSGEATGAGPGGGGNTRPGEGGQPGPTPGQPSGPVSAQVTEQVPGPDGGQGGGGDAGRAQSYPQGLRAGELSADDLTAVAAIQPDLGTLGQVLSDPARTTDAVHRAMLRAVSTGWRAETAGGDADDRKSYTGGVRAYVDNSIASVRLLPKYGTVTMAGDSASIPVTVANGLQQRLGGLELRVSSSAPNRLTVDNPVSVVRAPAAANHTGQVKVRAHANGPVRITAQLYTTANGRPWGAPTTFRVKVSRISPLVVAVIAAGVLLVLLAGAFKMRRTARRRGEGRGDGEGEGDGIG